MNRVMAFVASRDRFSGAASRNAQPVAQYGLYNHIAPKDDDCHNLQYICKSLQPSCHVPAVFPPLLAHLLARAAAPNRAKANTDLEQKSRILGMQCAKSLLKSAISRLESPNQMSIGYALWRVALG